MDEDHKLELAFDNFIGMAMLGQAALIGMIIASFLLLISFFTVLPFSAFAGFFVVPVAAMWIGWKSKQRAQRGPKNEA